MSEMYTILSAAWSSDPKAVIIQTAESGAVIVSEQDRPELWKQLMESGIDIAPYVPKEPSRLVPDSGHPATGTQDAHTEDMGKPDVIA